MNILLSNRELSKGPEDFHVLFSETESHFVG